MFSFSKGQSIGQSMIAVVGDISSLSFGFVGAYVLLGEDVDEASRSLLLVAALLVAYCGMFDLYRRQRLINAGNLRLLVRPLLLTSLTSLALSGPLGLSALNGWNGWIGCAVGALSVVLWRFGLRLLYSRRTSVARVGLIGSSESPIDLRLRTRIESDPSTTLVAAIDHRQLREAQSVLRKCELVLISASISADDGVCLAMDATALGAARVAIVPSAYELALANSTDSLAAGIEGVEVVVGAPARMYLVVKRCFDLVGAILGLVLLAPMFLFLAIAIRSESEGPALYRQVRVGRKGQPFSIVKLRTMVEGAEQESGPVFSAPHDERVTRLGQHLRRTRVDELPQLWNVLVGDMSLVGPRPERPIFVDEFDVTVRHYSARHAVRPGMTGLAQVSSPYWAGPEEKLRFDLLYLSRASLWNDLRIIIRTAAVVVEPDADSRSLAAFEPARGIIDLRDSDEVTAS